MYGTFFTISEKVLSQIAELESKDREQDETINHLMTSVISIGDRITSLCAKMTEKFNIPQQAKSHETRGKKRQTTSCAVDSITRDVQETVEKPPGNEKSEGTSSEQIDAKIQKQESVRPKTMSPTVSNEIKIQSNTCSHSVEKTDIGGTPTSNSKQQDKSQTLEKSHDEGSIKHAHTNRVRQQYRKRKTSARDDNRLKQWPQEGESKSTWMASETGDLSIIQFDCTCKEINVLLILKVLF